MEEMTTPGTVDEFPTLFAPWKLVLVLLVQMGCRRPCCTTHHAEEKQGSMMIRSYDVMQRF
jgi:hypothetical protein